MKNNQESDFEKMISDSIEKALQSGDFSALKQTLGTTVQNVIEKNFTYGGEVGGNISSPGGEAPRAGGRSEPTFPAPSTKRSGRCRHRCGGSRHSSARRRANLFSLLSPDIPPKGR